MAGIITGGSVDRKTGVITHKTETCTEEQLAAYAAWLYGYDEENKQVECSSGED